MPNVHKIALFGMGHLYKNVLTPIPDVSANKIDKSFDFDLSVIFNDKHVTLTDIYKHVKRKYYPEKDTYLQKK